MDNYYTFLYVRRGNAGVRSIRIHRILAFSAVAALLAVIITVISLAMAYSGRAREAGRVAALEKENARLSERIAGFQHEIDELRQRMAINFDLQNRARLLASLEPITEEVWDVGIGGPEAAYTEDPTSNAGSLLSLEGGLDKLVRQSKLQLESYEEIVSILEQEKQIRDCTPSIRPLKGGYLSSRFGRRMDPFTGRISFHRGIDYHARTGTSVTTTADGIVTMARKRGSFGLVVEVDHGNGFKTRYAHLSKILVKRGQRVKRSECIGLVGNTGLSTASHLHYEILFRKVHRDPLQYIIPEDTYYD